MPAVSRIDEYMKYATEVGETSLRTEPGVLTMYAVGEKENPCHITILETYIIPIRFSYARMQKALLYGLIYLRNLV